ncbi:MAG: hypothetical protein HYX63_02505 [Gammaproteobacteria bacterium]|nr:hypothetical protein [Gammaproteobacteria bacterium]
MATFDALRSRRSVLAIEVTEPRHHNDPGVRSTALLGALVLILDGSTDTAAAEAWEKEILRRFDEIDAGRSSSTATSSANECRRDSAVNNAPRTGLGRSRGGND